jgi:hypothetical protein
MVFNHYRTDFRRLWFTAIILLLVALQTASAQKIRSEAPPFKERLFFGGSFGLQIGTITDIEASPIIGFWVLPRLAIATGPNYRFYKDTMGKTSIYGGRGYTEFVIIKDINSIIPVGINMGIFFHLEDEFLSLESEFWQNLSVDSDRFTVNTLLAGAGLSQSVGRRSSINMMILWALNDSEYDIYNGPEFRVSFIF